MSGPATMQRHATTAADGPDMASLRRALFRELRGAVPGFVHIAESRDRDGAPVFEVGLVDVDAWTAPSDYHGVAIIVRSASPAHVPVGEAPAA